MFPNLMPWECFPARECNREIFPGNFASFEGVSGGEEKRGIGVKRDFRGRMLKAKSTIETCSVFSDRDNVTF